jgi:uncharacterized protein
MRVTTKSIPIVIISGCISSWVITYPIAASGQVASFECAKPAIAAEAAICRVPSLGAKDVEMATLYRILITVHPARSGMAYREFRDDLRNRQADWIKNIRNACKDDVACLHQAYDQRINTLSSTITKNLRLTYGETFN